MLFHVLQTRKDSCDVETGIPSSHKAAVTPFVPGQHCLTALRVLRHIAWRRSADCCPDEQGLHTTPFECKRRG